MPLTITRNELTETPPYIAEVQKSLLLDHCAWLLAQAALPSHERSPFNAPNWEAELFMYPGDGVVEGPAYAVLSDGITPLTGWHMQNAGISCLALYFTANNLFMGAPGGDFNYYSPSNAMSEDLLPLPRVALRVEPMGGFGGESLHEVAIREMNRFMSKFIGYSSVCFVVHPHMGSILYERRYLDRQEYQKDIHDEIRSSSGWMCLRSSPDAPDPTLDPTNILQVLACANSHFKSSNAAIQGFGIYRIDWEKSKQSLFSSVWEELNLPPIIPFDKVERNRSCARAYNMLHSYLKLYDAVPVEKTP